jgi:multidrug resistance efflux pump
MLLPRPSISVASLGLAALLLASGCGRSASKRVEAASAKPVFRPAGMLLSGEISAAQSTVLTVPFTPMWMVRLRWIENDGTPVKADQKVAEFDSTTYGNTLDQLKTGVSQAETGLVQFEDQTAAGDEERAFAVEQSKNAREKARIEAAIPLELRARREHEEKQLALRKAESDLEKALEDLRAFRAASEADRGVLKIGLEKARHDLAVAEDAIEALTLRAPRDGFFVIGDHFRESRKIQSGDDLWPGVTVGRIPDLSRLEVQAWLPDVDDGRIHLGQSVTVAPDAFPGRNLQATIREIGPLAQPPTPDSLRRAFKVRVSIEGGEIDGLKPGMSVRVETGPTRVGALAALPENRADPKTLLKAAEEILTRREDLVITVETRGVLVAMESEQLGPPHMPDQWESRISFLAPEGSTVKKGAPVLGFDTTGLQDRLNERMAEAATAKKQIERRTKDLELQDRDLALRVAEAEGRKRKAQLKVDVPANLAGANELAVARLDLELATLELDSLLRRQTLRKKIAEAELSIYRRQLQNAESKVRRLDEGKVLMNVKAPRDGTVIYLTSWRDEKKKVGDTCWIAEKVIEVPSLESLGVRAEVDEAESGLVREGQRVRLSLEAYPDTEFTGKVSLVRRMVGRQSPRRPLKVVRLEAGIDKIDTQKMRPGMRIKGEIEIERARQVVTVPLDALFVSPEGPIVYSASRKPIRVTVGRRNATKAEILSGLDEGVTILRPAAAAKKDTA